MTFSLWIALSTALMTLVVDRLDPEFWRFGSSSIAVGSILLWLAPNFGIACLALCCIWLGSLFFERAGKKERGVLGSFAALFAGAIVVAMALHSEHHAAIFAPFDSKDWLLASEHYRWPLIGLVLVVAGIFPFHGIVFRLQASRSWGNLVTFFAALPGLALIEKIGFDRGALTDSQSFVLFSFFLIHACYRAISACVITETAGAVWAIFLAQSSLILAAAFGNELTHSALLPMVLSLQWSSVILFGVISRLIRIEGATKLMGYRGLALRFPEEHRFFVVVSLLWVGIPGGLTFLGEDILFHGFLELSLSKTLVLIALGSLNVIALYHVYSHLFLGPASSDETRESRLPNGHRRIYQSIVVIGLILGLMPGLWLERILSAGHAVIHGHAAASSQ